MIPIAATPLSSISPATSDLLKLRSRIDDLSSQLSSGRRAETFGGLGIERSDSLNIRAMLSALSGYDAAIASVQPRVQLTSASLAQISKSTATLRNALASNVTDGSSSVPLARDALANVISALNQRIGERYVFGGRDGGSAPVLGADLLLNGDASDPARPLAGLRTLVAEQIKADRGEGNGRLTISNPTSTSILLREDPDAGVRANFGFTLAGPPVASAFATITFAPTAVEGAIPRFSQPPIANDHFRVVVNQASGGQKTYDLAGADLADTSSAANATSSLLALIENGKIASVQSGSPPGLTASFANGGAPGSLTINVAAQPAKGDTLSIKLALHDGTTTTVTLEAQPNADPGSTTGFTIGATSAETAQNLSSTLQRALKAASDTVLSASSTVRAAQDFFAGQNMPGLAPRRIDFTGSTPTYAQTSSTSTVLWYRGDSSSAADARESVVVRTSATGTIAIGARANEESVRAALAAFAVVSVTDPKADATGSAEGWKALATRALSVLPPRQSIDALSNEFDLALAALSEAQAQNKATRGILQPHLDALENVSTETVIVELVNLQNRLQASYQVTSMVSKLSLVNYLR